MPLGFDYPRGRVACVVVNNVVFVIIILRDRLDRLSAMYRAGKIIAIRLAGLCLGTLLVAGCAGFTPQPGPAGEPAGDYRLLTKPFIALGDTQEHESTGYPLHDNDSAVDAYVEVAQRPPEQTLFGRRLLEWALHSLQPEEHFLHLGDVMDLSCRVEAWRMAKIFRAEHHSGAILPGNHDGLFFGIYAINVFDGILDTDATKWNRACRRGAAPEDERYKTDNEAFTKRDVINLYIATLTKRNPPKHGLLPPPEAGSHEVSWRNPDREAFFSGIEAKLLDGINYADSFLAQRLRLPRAEGATRDVIVIGFDTNQAGLLVSSWDTLMGRSPGSVGHINADQIEAVTGWVDEAIANDDIVIFAGHHNWRSLGLPARVRLGNLMGRVNHPLVYLSAHTHRGFWAEHRDLGPQPLLEMNVSSLSDWPLAYRRISFAYDEKARRLLVRADLLPAGDKPVASYADLLAAWRQQTCAKSGVSVASMETEDLALVKRQRESRGSLVEWLLESLNNFCESCDTLLYEHAQRYQDELLQALIEVGADLGRDAHQLHELELPAWCGSGDYADCARALLAERAEGHDGQVNLFRRKATLVSLLNDHLDDLDSDRARAYLTCRAVEAAKIDFDLMPDDANEDRGEAKRMAEQFFRTEASVGMD